MDIVIDFDGTVVTHEFPEIGSDIGAVPVLKELIENGHKLILFTMRSDIEKAHSGTGEIISKDGNFLTDAINWFKENGIELYGIQRNPAQDTWTNSPKAYGQIIIDDAALGCPLINDAHKRPFVNWEKVREHLSLMNVLPKKLSKDVNCRKKILTEEHAKKIVCRDELKGLNTGRKTGLQRSYYYCNECKAWHTTTMIEPKIKM